MKILVAKVLCLLGVFVLMLLGSLLPVKLIEADYEKAHRSRKVLALCNSFGGGVFLATCFNALLPAVREKLQEVLKLGNVTTDYPLAETIMLVGFFMTVFVEQLILTFQKEKPSFIDLETFNAGSDVGSDSEYESPFIAASHGRTLYNEHSHHSHSHGLNIQELSRSSPLRLFSLVFALSAHSIFEGLALGLQEEGDKVMSLFLGVAIHETLVAVALGISMAKTSLALKDAAKLAVTVSLMIPLGIGIGMGIESARNVASSVASVVLQGIAGGTFLFVTFFEILGKELEDKNDRLLKVLFLVLGYAVLAGLVFFKWCSIPWVEATAGSLSGSHCLSPCRVCGAVDSLQHGQGRGAMDKPDAAFWGDTTLETPAGADWIRCVLVGAKEEIWREDPQLTWLPRGTGSQLL
ncbi:zinc transporter ZIP3 [Alligator mississippiensis]|uniref:Zinc transporter ZIP3 n=2 Tax=Alligator mississippiensis TaxID=8496 RepID=A0A151NRY3_ALLMI|nr:zinc transporter ZIP3 [Alligator mississippiensis]